MPTLPPIARSLLDAIAEPALLLDGHRVLALNPAARALLGESAEGKDVRLAIRHPEALELILAGATGGQREVVGIGRADRPWLLTVNELSNGLRLVRMTDRGEARSAERQRVDFGANARPERRPPLATIIGYGETLAEDGPLDEPLRQQFGGTILTEARRMLRLIEELMSLSRIEAGRFITPTEKLDLGDIVAVAISDTAELARECGAAVRVEAGPSQPLVKGDRSQLVQLATNLIANALRYGCAQSGEEVVVSLTRKGDGHVELAVADSGEGIAPEHLPRLTERFYRVDAARSRDSGGTGLGLAIVKHIVERHGGSLAIRSSVGAGTTVTVTLPAA